MTNTEIKKLIAILKQEGCNSKKQALEYLESKLTEISITKIDTKEPKSYAITNTDLEVKE